MSAETASVSPVASFEKCSVVLLDVQGTTTSLTFFKDQFFPYVTKNAEEFLKANWEDEAVKAAVKDLSEKELDLEAATKTVVELTDSSSENKGLKVLQGLITKKGYADGELKAHVFDDIPEALASWAKSRKVAIYSTGAVDTQKQFFSNTVKGDLSAHISNYYDQAVGVKTEADSYKRIAEELAIKPEEVVFVSDREEEGKAAKTAGMSVALIVREGNAELSEEAKKNYPVVNSFSEITFEEKVCKRKNTEEAEEPPTKVAKTEEKEKVDAKMKETIESESMEVDSSEKKTEETKAEEKPAKVERKMEEKIDAVDSTEKIEEAKETAKSAKEEAKTEKSPTEEKPAENEVDSTSKAAENCTVEKKEETESKADEKASSTTEENVSEATEKKSEEKIENGLEKEDKKEVAVTNGDAETTTAAVETNGETEKNSKAEKNGEAAKNSEAEKKEESDKPSETNGSVDDKANGTSNGDSKDAKVENIEIKVKKVPAEAESSTEIGVEV